MKNKYSDIDSLHSLIQKYFDGETSLDEERCLRQVLASTELQSETIDEAKAVLGFFATQRSIDKHRPQQSRRHIWAAAAAIAVLIIGSVGIFNMTKSDKTEYTCYIAGTYSDSKEDSFAIMQSQLSDISDARNDVYDGIANEIDNIFEITNL